MGPQHSRGGRRGAGAVRGFADLLLVRRGPYAYAFENLTLTLILVSVASIGVEALPGLPGWLEGALRWGEILIAVIFSVEYVLRIVAAENNGRSPAVTGDGPRAVCTGVLDDLGQFRLGLRIPVHAILPR